MRKPFKSCVFNWLSIKSFLRRFEFKDVLERGEHDHVDNDIVKG